MEKSYFRCLAEITKHKKTKKAGGRVADSTGNGDISNEWEFDDRFHCFVKRHFKMMTKASWLWKDTMKASQLKEFNLIDSHSFMGSILAALQHNFTRTSRLIFLLAHLIKERKYCEKVSLSFEAWMLKMGQKLLEHKWRKSSLVKNFNERKNLLKTAKKSGHLQQFYHAKIGPIVYDTCTVLCSQSSTVILFI